MSLPGIVCPPDRGLLESFTGRAVTVRVGQPGLAVEAAEQVRKSGNHLFCVIVESSTPLCRMEFGENLQGIPLAVMAPSWGTFRHLAPRIQLLRDLNLRVYLPGDNLDNLAGLRILSSLGIHTCAVLGEGPKEWGALADLMTYAVLERVPHGPMDPFSFIASHYDPFSYLDWGAIYFDDPKRFLHLDAQGRVALSAGELRKKRFIAPSLSEIGMPSEFPAIQERLRAWRRFFVDCHPCAVCAGWRICLGKFAGEELQEQGCAVFFGEMVEVARQYQARKVQDEGGRVWQP